MLHKVVTPVVLEPVKLLASGMYTQSPKSFNHDVMNKKRYQAFAAAQLQKSP